MTYAYLTAFSTLVADFFIRSARPFQRSGMGPFQRSGMGPFQRSRRGPLNAREGALSRRRPPLGEILATCLARLVRKTLFFRQ